MDENQTFVPESFVDLYLTEGRAKLSEPRSVIEGRYALCEDMASLLCSTANSLKDRTGCTESEVVKKIRIGLLDDASGFSDTESLWICFRLAELSGWMTPTFLGEAPDSPTQRWLDRQYKMRRLAN